MYKLTTLSCLLILFFNSAYSQNFQTIHANQTTYFKHWTHYDHMDLNSGDIIVGSYENYIAQVTVNNLPFINASIFGKYTSISANGLNNFVNRNDDTIKIETLAGLGDSWILFSPNPDSLFMATVTHISIASVLGIMQEVKEIKIELRSASNQLLAHPFNGKKIRIAENLGFVTTYNFRSFPSDTTSFVLCGNSSGLGVHPLKESEIYDFEIGDEFHYSKYVDDEATNYTYTTSYIKLKILTKTKNDNSVSYTADRIQLDIQEISNPSFKFTHDVISITHSFQQTYPYNTYIDDDGLVTCEQSGSDEILTAYEWKKKKGLGLVYDFFTDADYHPQPSHKSNLVYSKTQLGELGDRTFLNTIWTSHSLLNDGSFEFSSLSDFDIYNDIPSTSCFWDFGDGQTSTDKTPIHFYANAGMFKVTLTINMPNIGSFTFHNTLQVGPNIKPVALKDTISTLQDNPVTIDVLANDFDSDGFLDSNSVDLNSSLSEIQTTYSNAAGVWKTLSKGIVQFSPSFGFVGEAKLNYAVSDNRKASSTYAQIIIIVSPGNLVPVTSSDNANTYINATLTLYVTENDVDDKNLIDGATIDLDVNTLGIQSSFSSPEGVFSSLGNGFISFTPSLDFVGTVSIDYVVNDNIGQTSNSVTISIEVLNMIPPVVIDDVINITEDQNISFKITDNDSDADGFLDLNTIDFDPLTAGIQSTIITLGGTLTASPSGFIDFNPLANYFGAIYQYYLVSDNLGNPSQAGLVTIKLNAVNDVPHTNNDWFSGNEDSPSSYDILKNDIDVDGNVFYCSVDLDPNTIGTQTVLASSEGTWSLAGGGILTFTPILNFNGSVSMSYVLTDSQGQISNSAMVNVSVLPINDKPISNSDTISTDEDVAISLNITSNDIDIDNTLDLSTVDLQPSILGIQQTLTTTKGAWMVDNMGVLTFTPSLNFSGISALNYIINDELGASSSMALISITVNSINDVPIALDDIGGSFDNDTVVTLNPMSNDTDAEGKPTISSGHTVDLDADLIGIQHTFSTTEATWTYVESSDLLSCLPNPEFAGTTTIYYQLCDPESACSMGKVSFIFIDATPPIIGQDQLLLYPNPTSEKLQIKAENLEQIQILTLDGILIYEAKNPSQIDISKWSTGMYLFVALFENGKVIHREIVKE